MDSLILLLPQENPDEGEGAEAAAGASKKDPTVRRREILGQGTESLGHALAEAAAGSAAALLQSPLGNEVLVEVACGGETGEPVSCAPAAYPVHAIDVHCTLCARQSCIASKPLASDEPFRQQILHLNLYILCSRETGPHTLSICCPGDLHLMHLGQFGL